MSLSFSLTAEPLETFSVLPEPGGQDPTNDLSPAVASLAAALEIPPLETWLLVGEMALAAGKSELCQQAVAYAHELAPADTRVGRLALRAGDRARIPLSATSLNSAADTIWPRG